MTKDGSQIITRFPARSSNRTCVTSHIRYCNWGRASEESSASGAASLPTPTDPINYEGPAPTSQDTACSTWQLLGQNGVPVFPT